VPLTETETETEKLHGHLFDRAMVLRDSGEYCAAIQHHRPVPAARIYRSELGALAALEYASRASAPSPKHELSSLGLFHTLHGVGRMTDALQEMVRFLRIRASTDYLEDPTRPGLKVCE
jgi:hypothetical protein